MYLKSEVKKHARQNAYIHAFLVVLFPTKLRCKHSIIQYQHKYFVFQVKYSKHCKQILIFEEKRPTTIKEVLHSLSWMC